MMGMTIATPGWVIYTCRGAGPARRHVVPAGVDPSTAYHLLITRMVEALRREPQTYPGRVWLVRPDGITARDAYFPWWPNGHRGIVSDSHSTVPHHP